MFHYRGSRHPPAVLIKSCPNKLTWGTVKVAFQVEVLNSAWLNTFMNEAPSHVRHKSPKGLSFPFANLSYMTGAHVPRPKQPV